MNSTNAGYYHFYESPQSFFKAAAEKIKGFPLTRSFSERNGSGDSLLGIFLYIIAMATVAVSVVSGHFPWFLSILAIMLVMSLLFPQGNQDAQ